VRGLVVDAGVVEPQADDPLNREEVVVGAKGFDEPNELEPPPNADVGFVSSALSFLVPKRALEAGNAEGVGSSVVVPKVLKAVLGADAPSAAPNALELKPANAGLAAGFSCSSSSALDPKPANLGTSDFSFCVSNSVCFFSGGLEKLNPELGVVEPSPEGVNPPPVDGVVAEEKLKPLKPPEGTEGGPKAGGAAGVGAGAGLDALSNSFCTSFLSSLYFSNRAARSAKGSALTALALAEERERLSPRKEEYSLRAGASGDAVGVGAGAEKAEGAGEEKRELAKDFVALDAFEPRGTGGGAAKRRDGEDSEEELERLGRPRILQKS
jgi:hypothetical protein